MPLHSLRRALVAAFCLSPVSVFAQNAVPELDTVVVTASRTPQILEEAMGDITVVGREELQRAGGDSVAEILARQPGVQISNKGGPQTETGIMLRGAETRHTLVLIDGMRINSSFGENVNWNAVDPAAIERIEILRGAASSLYGSDAIGGVINIITRKGDQDRPLSAWADFGVGTHSTVKTGTGFSGSSEGWDYSITASMAESDGHNVTTPENSSYYHADKDGYSQHTLAGSLGYKWAPGHHLGVNFYNSYIDGDVDGFFGAHPATSITRQQAYSLTSTNSITEKWESILRLSLSKEMGESRVADDPSSTFGSLQRLYSWQNNFKLTEDQSLSAYVERLEERPVSSSGLDVNERNTNSLGAVYTGHFGRHKLQASVRNDNISGHGNEVTGGLGYDFALNDAWTVGIAGNTGFKAPIMRDLYGPISWGSNPDLKPEKSRNIEAHVQYQKGGLDLGATVYQNKIRDLISYVPVAPFFSVAQNVDRATIRGATLTAGYEWDNTTLRATADFIRPRDDSTGERLIRRARQQYMVSAEHRIDALRLGAEYQFTGNREDNAVDENFASYRTKLGGYSLWNLTAAYDFSPNASVQIRWNNVLDKDYTNVYGYKTMGSNVFVNLSLRM